MKLKIIHRNYIFILQDGYRNRPHFNLSLIVFARIPVAGRGSRSHSHASRPAATTAMTIDISSGMPGSRIKHPAPPPRLTGKDTRCITAHIADTANTGLAPSGGSLTTAGEYGKPFGDKSKEFIEYRQPKSDQIFQGSTKMYS